MDALTEPPSSETARVRFAGGTFPIVLTRPRTDHIQSLISRTGLPYEPDLLAAMADVLGPGDLVLDVGANIGNHTLWLAHACQVRVWAFEPNPELTTALEESLRLGGLEEQVRLFTGALGSGPSRGRLKAISEDNLGGFQVQPDPTGDIRVFALSDLDVPRVSALKIDVEGMETAVLQGALGVIDRDRPHLFVEAADNEAFFRLTELLEPRGYTCLASYNATPTHHFAPDLTVAEMRARVHRLVAESHSRRQEYLSTRADLVRTSDRYRALTRRQAEETETGRQKLAELREKVRRQQRRIRRLRHELAEATSEPAARSRLSRLFRRR